MWGLLEGGASFSVDAQRWGAYKRAALILLGLAQLYFYCTFFILPYFSYHILLQYEHFKG